MNMIEKYLKAKHWQIFLLLVGIPFTLHSSMMSYVFSFIPIQGDIEPAILIENITTYVFTFTMIWMGLVGGWIWAIAIGLQKMIPKDLRLNPKKFKISCFIPSVYILFMSWVFPALVHNLSLIGDYFLLIIPFHLASMFFILYCFFFTAKTLKTAELQHKVTFGNYFDILLMLWFFPLGIWVIQPKLNKLIQGENISQEPNSFPLLDDNMF